MDWTCHLLCTINAPNPWTTAPSFSHANIFLQCTLELIKCLLCELSPECWKKNVAKIQQYCKMEQLNSCHAGIQERPNKLQEVLEQCSVTVWAHYLEIFHWTNAICQRGILHSRVFYWTPVIINSLHSSSPLTATTIDNLWVFWGGVKYWWDVLGAFTLHFLNGDVNIDRKQAEQKKSTIEILPVYLELPL